jgi:hypothetical protein
MTYVPRPIDTSHVSLPPELEPLVEKLAASNHDNWAQGRISDGWTLGSERNDTTKTHPDLVPYEELSEAEKEYDRRSVIETLKAMLALGYRIEKRRAREDEEER